ncbi:MAG: GNAT family N-acetyltransferase [Pseudomonadota bacterium]
MIRPSGRAGETVTVTRTYLEMAERPEAPATPLPHGTRASVLAAVEPPVHWFLYLYGTIGRDWEWVDWFRASEAEQEAFVGSPGTSLHTLMLEGAAGGAFMLDTREDGICDLAYFGLMPHGVGRGLGRWFLDTAIRTGWDRPGVAKMTVNTCTLDHPAALGLYQRMGFRPVDQETEDWVLSRDYNL